MIDRIEAYVPAAARAILKGRMSSRDWSRFCRLHQELLEQRIDTDTFRRHVGTLAERIGIRRRVARTA
jgi:hypothetical protein